MLIISDTQTCGWRKQTEVDALLMIISFCMGISLQTTISNDGATIMTLLDVVHPAAKTLVDISLSQDAEVGDGTTSVVLLGAEFLRQAKPFIEENMHPQLIMKVY